MSSDPDDGALCVSCRRRPAASPWKPFCSERCRLLDLGRWLGGDYRIPGEPVPEDPASPGDKDTDA